MSGSLILTPPDGATGDSFGMSVCLSADGRTAIVGGYWDDVGSNADQGSARVFDWIGGAWVQRGGALTPLDGQASDRFGWSVAISADCKTAIVGGAWDDIDQNRDQGSARVFFWNGSAWVQRGAALTPTDGQLNDNFGIRVALSDDGRTAFVGGDYDSVGSHDFQGSVRAFSWDGAAWIEKGMALSPTDGSAGDFFCSHAITPTGNTIIIGGYGDDVGLNLGQGSARVFDWINGSWVQRGGIITPTDGAAGENWGLDVAMAEEGNTVILGGWWDDVGDNINQGSARVFTWTGASWTQLGSPITPTDGAAWDQFGETVALSANGRSAVIGGSWDDVGANADQGSARVFDWVGSDWIQRGGAITPADGAAGDGWGYAVSIAEDGLTVLIGGRGDDVLGNHDQGSARVFAWNGVAWVEGGPATGPFAPTEGADTISGTLNADTLAALAGDDVYIVNYTGDHVIEQVGGGMDTIITSVSMNLPANVEMMAIAPHIAGITLNGGAGNDVLVGNTLGNTINGGGGDDVILVGNVTLADIYALFVT